MCIRDRWRTAKEPRKLVIGHGQTLGIVEIAHVHGERAIGLEVHEFLEDQVHILRFTVRCQTHELVFARVNRESSKVSKSAIQQTERMREAQSLEQGKPIA